MVEPRHGRREQALQEARIELRAMAVVDRDLGRAEQGDHLLDKVPDLGALVAGQVGGVLGLQQLQARRGRVREVAVYCARYAP